jgi:hypothetical protein
MQKTQRKNPTKRKKPLTINNAASSPSKRIPKPRKTSPGKSNPAIGLWHREHFLADGKRMFAAGLKKALQTGKGNYGRVIEVCEALYEQAKKGNTHAISLIADRLDGRATQMLGSDPDNPLEITHKMEKAAPELTKEEWCRAHGIELPVTYDESGEIIDNLSIGENNGNTDS